MLKKIHFKRKIISLVIVVLAIVLFYLPKELYFGSMVFLSVVCGAFDLLYHKYGDTNFFTRLYFKLYPKKDHEYTRTFSDATIFFISTLLMMLLFSKEIVVYSIIVFMIADMDEHIFGILFHKGKLFWNKQKTWGGLLPGFVLGFIAGILTVYYIDGIEFSLHQIIWTSAVVALMGTLNDYDNVGMPWSSAILLKFIV